MSSGIRIPSRPAATGSSSLSTTNMSTRRRDKRAATSTPSGDGDEHNVPSFGSPAPTQTPAAEPSSSPASLTSSSFEFAGPRRTRTSSFASQSMDSSPRSAYLNGYMSHQDHVVLNVSSNPDTVRLLTYVRSGQGFNWNSDIFLPSSSHYASLGSPFSATTSSDSFNNNHGDIGADELALLDQRVPVHEIHLDDNDHHLNG